MVFHHFLDDFSSIHMLNYRRDSINRWHRLGCGVLLMRSRRIKRPWWDTTVSCRFQRWLIQFSNVEVLQVFVCRFLPRWKMVQASSWWFMQYILYLVRLSVYAIVTPCNTIVFIFDYIYKYKVIPPFMIPNTIRILPLMSCRSILHFM